MITLTEYGGGSTSKGMAHVVCAIDGSPLLSLRGYSVSNGIHAEFAVRFSVLTVKYSHRHGVGHGVISLVDENGSATELFTFTDAEPAGVAFDVAPIGTHSFAFPYAAVRAAWAKARDYHCRRAYYAVGNYAGGRSGPKGLGGGPSILKTGGLRYRPAQGETS
ncbi:MAG: hypothetical protein KatS3mg038_3557 [Candidatus Kapaibacterium sp.]|nr:MAG: hypothetical protein KatS3mg038_1859 [Candidatus Kapabacteria bacterium]GIV52464.1 MAG: hypothetical protein KatS3mg038_2985 [Candidatus Kapabacteria bacterium]GIV53036.1 MAG: hypothetical protein KatS3mg038_3557 [Candidatus Kapabacteria bacterium]